MALDEWIDEEVQLTTCLMKDFAWIKKQFDPFWFPEPTKFEMTNDEATQKTKINYGVDMMRCTVQRSSSCHWINVVSSFTLKSSTIEDTFILKVWNAKNKSVVFFILCPNVFYPQ